MKPEYYEERIYRKLKADEIFSDIECEYLAYYESLKSRGDSDHYKGSDLLVGAVVTKNNHVIACAHRANAFEGDHAEYSILKGKLNGCDLSECDFFTTLEPCVDAVRKQIGSSCSSLLCSSAVKRIHIGILDSSNPKVFGKGIEELFSSGKTLIPFSKEVKELIECSWLEFRQPLPDERRKVERVKSEVFSKFQEGSLEKYLTDKHTFERGKQELDPKWDFESAKDDFALLLLRKGLVVFEARKIEVDSQLKVMFYPSDRLKTSSRQIRVQYKDGRESADQPINDALPLAYDKLMSIFQKEFSPSGLDGTLYKEAVVNALIHSDYGENCPLIYLIKEKGFLIIKNKASENIPADDLEKLKIYSAPSYPGNGLLADLFNKAGYCERDSKGMDTIREAKPAPVYQLDGRIVILTLKLI